MRVLLRLREDGYLWAPGASHDHSALMTTTSAAIVGSYHISTVAHIRAQHAVAHMNLLYILAASHC